MPQIRLDCNLEMLSPIESHVLIIKFIFWGIFLVVASIDGTFWLFYFILVLFLYFGDLNSVFCIKTVELHF